MTPEDFDRALHEQLTELQSRKVVAKALPPPAPAIDYGVAMEREHRQRELETHWHDPFAFYETQWQHAKAVISARQSSYWHPFGKAWLGVGQETL